METEILVTCPHCGLLISTLKSQINCHIFRHGVYRHNYQQIDPHLNKLGCEWLIEQGLIYGCGKPYKLLLENGKYQAIVCDYI